MGKSDAPLAVLLLLVGLSACGGTDTVAQENLSPAAAVRQALERVDTESYRFDLKFTGGGSGEGGDRQDFTGGGEGAFRPGPSPASRVRMNLGPSGLGLGGGTVEFVTIGEDSWSRFGGGTDTGPAAILGFAGDKWTKSSEEFGTDDSDDLDVRKQVQLLLAATDLREIGPERIGDVETTRYSGTATPDTVSAATGLDPRTKADLIEELSDQKAPASLEVWLDRDQRIRRFVQSGVDSDGDYRASVDFRDFGAAIDIAPPPAKDVVDLDDLEAPALSPKQQAKLSKQFFESLPAKERRELCRSVADEEGFPVAPPADLEKLCAAK